MMDVVGICFLHRLFRLRLGRKEGARMVELTSWKDLLLLTTYN